MGLCQSSTRRQRREASSFPHSLQQPYGSIDRSIDEVEDDIKAVKSWREKRTTPPLPTTSTTTGSTALVVFNDRKLATIEEGINDSKNTSTSSPSLHSLQPPPHMKTMMMFEEIDVIPPSSPNGTSHAVMQYNSSNNDDYDYSYQSPPEQSTLDVVHKDYRTAETYVNPFQPLPDSNIENGIDSDKDNYNTTPPPHRNVNRGGFPSLYPDDEEEWKNGNNEPQQEDYLSSSSSQSTIEDPILVRTSTTIEEDDFGKVATGPIDLDDDDDDESIDPCVDQKQNDNDDVDDVDILSSSFLSSSSKRPGPDDAKIDRPVSKHRATDKVQSSPSSSSILRDKEPELYSINNSAESEELDAMIAAIDSSGSDKVPTIPLPTTTRQSTSRSVNTARSSHRNSQSPTLQLVASQQSSPSVHSGSRNSVPSIKLSPSHRDSPSVHDPTSYMVPHDDNDDSNNIFVEKGISRNAPTLVSPSSDGSASIGPLAAVTTTTLTTSRGRAAHHSSSSTTTATIPETAQGRRKARSQSRGRRVRERARTLLSSYRNVSNDLPGPEQPKNFDVTGSVPTVIQPEPTIVQPDSTLEENLGNVNFNPSHRTIGNDKNEMKYANPETVSAGLPPTQSRYDYSNNVAEIPNRSAFTMKETLRPVATDDMDHSDRLSDIPSEVDPMLRERYLKACRILKSSLLEKDSSIHPSDKEFLSQLLLETTPSKDEDDSNVALTEEKVKQYESTVHNTILDRSTPLFDTATTIITTTDEFSHTTGDAPSYNNVDHQTIRVAASGESSGVTEQELQIHNYVMNDHYAATDSFRSKHIPNNDTTPTPSQVSSSVFSRVDDDYPHVVLGLNDGGRQSKVLLPWMMNALRGFFPLEISNYNFWLKYHLDRTTDINHEDNVNLMTLLSKVQNDTYTVICVQTVDGHVFGAFCSTPWKSHSSWYGSGEASFLWRLKQPRRGRTSNVSDAHHENGSTNEIEIYPYTRYDSYVQYCANQTLAVGGGTDWTLTKEGYSPYVQTHPLDRTTPPDDDRVPSAAGIGFLLDGDLMGGETNSCVTYANPSLGSATDGSNEFDIQTLEVYTLTKFSTIKEVEENQ